MKQFQFTDADRETTFPVRNFEEATAGMDAMDQATMAHLDVGKRMRMLSGFWTRLPDVEPEAPTADIRRAGERLERIATAALQGFLAGADAGVYPDPTTTAAFSVEMARALVTELDKQP